MWYLEVTALVNHNIIQWHSSSTPIISDAVTAESLLCARPLFCTRTNILAICQVSCFSVHVYCSQVFRLVVRKILKWTDTCNTNTICFLHIVAIIAPFKLENSLNLFDYCCTSWDLDLGVNSERKRMWKSRACVNGFQILWTTN